MNRFNIIVRLVMTLSGLAGALLAFSAGAAHAAVARVMRPLGGDPHGRPGLVGPRPAPPGWTRHSPLPAHAHPIAASGMSGWQIILIVAGSAVLTAALAVSIYQMRTARRRAAASAA
jgi:heme/copper-type cytochrome/quinol oxidase subunit 1